MSWLTNIVRPKLRALVKADIPDNLWTRCSGCEQMLFHRELNDNLQVCKLCNHHFRMDSKDRLQSLFDDSQYTVLKLPAVITDPLHFKDQKKYSDRLKQAKNKTNTKDAIQVGRGKISGQKVIIAAFNFAFIGGSMGTAVGEAIVTAAEAAQASKAALVVIPASGGARMHEGILSLMQMARTTIAISQVKEKGLPYITVLADPTSGGVAASFAMLGDITLAEPGAMIGFAGPRVIKETIGTQLPPNFQTAEYLLEHGMVDRVVARADLKNTLGVLLKLLRQS
ncbi:MAG: acetyl-CoA carboxylase, carboxyltransferase subunit beta [Pseudomonadota bacterium]